MTVPPLFDHLDTADDDQLRRDTTSQDVGFEAGTEHRATRAHPGGVRERAQAWLHVEPFYWTMRVVYVCLAAGAVFAVYINGVAEGWWHAWGEKPSVAATAPATQPTPAPSLSSEAAMSGGYQIGPDGVLIRPAQFAADTYTKPELPEEAKENTERGAELAAEYVVVILSPLQILLRPELSSMIQLSIASIRFIEMVGSMVIHRPLQASYLLNQLQIQNGVRNPIA